MENDIVIPVPSIVPCHENVLRSGGEQSASCLGCSTPSIHWMGGWVAPELVRMWW